MSDAICYYRVSTDDQFESGAGLAAQRDACLQYAARSGLVVVAEFEEDGGVSGSTPLESRPALVEAFDSLNKGGVLLVAKRDRIARDNIAISLFEAMVNRKKCRIVSAAGEGTELDPNDPVAFLTKGIVDLFSKFEVLQLRFRTRGGLRAKRRRGERNGQTPFGWDLHDDGRRSKTKHDRKTGAYISGGKPIALRENPAEQAALRLMARLHKEGSSLASIAAELNAQGIRTKAGKPWARSSIAYCLKVSIPLLKGPDDEVKAQATTVDPALDAGRPAPVGDRPERTVRV